jgi:hypothetical protein
LRILSLFCGNGTFHLKVDFGGEIHFKLSPRRHGCPARCSDPMAITVPNYGRKTDRLQFGMPIGITSER